MGKIEVKTGQTKKLSPADIILPRGPRISSGGYTYLRTGKLPKKRQQVEKYLTWIRELYVQDIAGEEVNMTAGQDCVAQ